MNITCEFTSSKFQTLVATTSQNKGMVSCFVLGPFERRDSHLSTAHRPPKKKKNPPSNTQSTCTHFTPRSHKQKMETLERKAEKLSKSPSVSSFPFQMVLMWSDFICSFCVLSRSQKSYVTICELPVPQIRSTASCCSLQDQVLLPTMSVFT